jgi:hypothetical protein
MIAKIHSRRRLTRDPHKFVRLEIAFFAFLSLTVWSIRELRGIL